MAFFFDPTMQLGASFFNHELGVSPCELLKMSKTLNGFLNFCHLSFGNIPGDMLPIFVALVVVIRPLGSFTNNVKRSPFHALDLCNLLKNRLRGNCFAHGEQRIYT